MVMLIQTPPLEMGHPLSLARDTAIIRLLLQHGAVAADLYKYSSLLPEGSPISQPSFPPGLAAETGL